MNSAQIASMIDHSALQPWLTDDDIRRACDAALRYKTASVCARPTDMPLVSAALSGSGIAACTVIGFPHGTQRTDVKLFEARRAIDDGATELDMVVNVGKLRGLQEGYALDEIAELNSLCHDNGAKLKVIFENCYLTRDEIAWLARRCGDIGVDYIKTSTGYGKYGARLCDLVVMRRNAPVGVGLKAAGGIRTLDTLLLCTYAGANRIGASATDKIMAEAYARERDGLPLEVSDEEFENALAAEQN